MTVTDGKCVSIEYTVMLEDQTQVDTNVGGEPFTYTQGEQGIPSALQKRMESLEVGERTRVILSPEEGYGPVNPNAFHEVDRSRIPKENWKVGTQLTTRSSTGQTLRPIVHEIKENTIVLDFNHPLAGQTLAFDIKILKVEDPSP